MATVYNIGDFVEVEGKTGVIEQIVLTPLGYCTYRVFDMDTGHYNNVAKHQMHKIEDPAFAQDLTCEWNEDLVTDLKNEITTEDTGKAASRHVMLSEQEMDAIAKQRLAPNTEQQTKWAVSLFKDFLKERNQPEDFEEYPVEDLAKSLRALYCCMQQKTGKEYGRSGYHNLRAGLQRVLVSPPFNRKLDLRNDKDFQEANQVFEGQLKKMKREGKDTTTHKMAITPADMQQMYASKVLGIEEPVALQRKVFVELGLHFARRGREGWRELRKDSFAIKTDDSGRKYVCLNINEFDKNHAYDEQKSQLMYENPEDPNCPVKSFALYLSKLHPEQPALFQRPDAAYRKKPTWYINAPIGVNTISNMLKSISKEAQTSTTYTNHCLKATAGTVLKKAGIPTKDIMCVTGHKNSASLDSYVAGPNSSERAKMSNILANYAKPVASTSAVTLPIQNAIATSKDVAIGEQAAITSSCTMMSHRQMSFESLTSGLFQGANFNAPVTINVKIN